MIELKIAGQKFKAPYKLTDITLYKYVEYLEWRDENLPTILKDLESIEGETAEEIIQKRRDRYELITNKEEQELLNFYCLEVGFWLDADYKLIRRCDIADVTHVWHLIQNGLQPIEETDYNCFLCKDEIYYLPERLMPNSTFEDYAESCQYEEQMSKLARGEYKVLPYIAAILGRKKDDNGKLEGYDDYDVKVRSGLFNAHLTANDAMQIGFFFAQVKREIANKFPNIYDSPEPEQIKAGYKELIQPYGWFATYQALADGDVLKLNEINKLSLWTVMAHLSYKSAENTYLRNLQNVNQ